MIAEAPITTTSVATFLATFGRTAAWSYSAPLIGDKGLPAKFRIVAAASIALALCAAHRSVELEALPLTLPGELLLGLIAGFTLRILMAGIEAGGQLIGLQMELGFASLFDPILKEDALVTRRIAFCLGGLAFIGTGGFESSVRVLGRASVDGHTIERAFHTFVPATAEVLVVAVRLSAPLILAAVVANLAVGLASRAAPALNVFSVMLALIAAVCGVALVATAPALVGDILGIVGHAESALRRAVGL